MDPSRRSLLRGSPRRNTPVRPPWSMPEDLFTTRCTRCDECLRVCETGLLQPGSGGFPEARFERAGCSLCRKCAAACEPGVIRFVEDSRPWLLKAAINTACMAQQGVVCRTCGERCEARAIRFRPERGGVSRPRLDPALCTGCGMCVADCPARAIALHPYEHIEETLA